MNKNNIYKSFQTIIIIICLLLIFKILFEEEEIKNILINLNFYKFLPCILISVFITLFYSQLIFNIILATTKIKISSRKWLYIFLNSQFLDTIPFAGFFYKAIRLKKYNLEYKYFLYSYLFIFTVWIILYLFFFSIDSLLLFFFFENNDYVLLSIICILLATLTLFLIKLLNYILIKINFKKKIFIKLKLLIFFIKKNILKIKTSKIFLKYGIMIHLFEFVLYVIVIDFLQLDLSIRTIFVIFFVNSVIDFFPLTPKNIGFSELITGGLLSFIGFNFTSGVILKLFVRVSSLLSTTALFFLNNIFFNDEI
tara:strand:- start:6 stop:935 length:930 start_codon:yes stop_codon:yes gene_type:complete